MVLVRYEDRGRKKNTHDSAQTTTTRDAETHDPATFLPLRPRRAKMAEQEAETDAEMMAVLEEAASATQQPEATLSAHGSSLAHAAPVLAFTLDEKREREEEE